MIYPDNIERKLGFDIIRKKLASYCFSELGMKLVEEIGFETDPELIKLQLDQVSDFKELTEIGKVPVSGPVKDVSPYLIKSEIKDNWLDPHELYDVDLLIITALGLSNFLIADGHEFSSLGKLAPIITHLSVLHDHLAKSVDEDGNVLSSASRDLKSIRGQIIIEEGSLRKSLDRIFKKAKADGLVPDGSSVGVRDGRMVIPIIASSKRQIQGFVHDETASGNTVFLEPTETLSSNNKIRELQISEAREIRKILTKLTFSINENGLELADANIFIGRVDSLWARAKLAKILGATKPKLASSGMRLRALRHPLLVLSYHENKREVIAQDINLGKSSRILLISGPNAGGKSVALKNVGLNQYMLQAGILPCCKADSEFSVFKNLIIDIGDEQSIDNDLSTYSSHLKNTGVMLKEADEHSLIFIDEFGSGTDPSFGGAIAEAVLGKLISRGCFGVITTHFSNLKVYADKTEGMVNAAMIFDIDRLMPLYQLETGRPGSSFSLEVALRVGLPKDVIKLAEEGVGTSQIDIEKLLNKLEAEKQQYAEQNIKLVKKEEDLTRLRKEYSELKSKLEAGKKDIINRAKEEAEIILSRTNKEIEKTIRHIKENRAEKKETIKVRNSLKEFSKKVFVKDNPEKSASVITVTDPVKSGDQALLISKDVVVKVVEIKGKKAKVLIGELQSVVALNNLKKISNRKVKEKGKQQFQRSVGYEVNEKMANFSATLDVRGTRASDLLQKISQFLDDAIMLNQPSLKIIHGRGNGVLRELVQEELKHWQQIASYEYEHEERGGDGSTLIKMK